MRIKKIICPEYIEENVFIVNTMSLNYSSFGHLLYFGLSLTLALLPINIYIYYNILYTVIEKLNF